MFGGLELKGTSASPPAKQPTENDKSADAEAAETTASSAFSFLNSFMSSTASNNNHINNNNNSVADTTETYKGIPSPTADATTTTGSALNVASSFGFLSSSTSAVAPPTATASSFDFLQSSEMPASDATLPAGMSSGASASATGTTNASTNASANTSTNASTNASSAMLNTSVDSILADTPLSLMDWGGSSGMGNNVMTPAGASTATFGLHSTMTPASAVGSGIVFGGAEVKKAVKKRVRTAKIGAAAQQSLPPSLPTPPPPTERKQPASTLTGSTTINGSGGTGSSGILLSNHTSGSSSSNIHTNSAGSTIRDGALDATRRAEEFLHAKVLSDGHHPANTADLTIRSVPSEDDDVIIAAKAAAKEAHKLEAKKGSGSFGRSNSGTSGGGGFGSLFRSRAKSPPTQQSSSRMASMSSTSLGSSSSTDLDGPVSVTATGPSTSQTRAVPSTGAERLQKEQEDVKRAMAERQWKMMQQQQHIHPNTISEDSAEDSVSSYQPAVASATPPGRSFMVSVKPASTPHAIASSTKQVDIISNLPKPVTARDKLDQMLEDFRRQVVRAMNEMTRLRQQRTGLLEERFVTNAKERLAGQQKARALEQQAAAAESEDFELADTMSTLIDRHGQEQAEYAAILENIGRAISMLDQQKRSCANDVTRYFQDIQDKLCAVQTEQQTADSKKATESLDAFSAISKQLSVEHERLQNDWKHLERDGELVAEERRELEKAISEQSGAFETLRDQARAKLVSVEDEIEELRSLLQAKQRVAAELRTEAAGHDESVLKVRVKFARQLTRLQKKEMTIQDNTEEWESEKRSFELQKQQHEIVVQEHSEAMIARDQLLDDIGQEMDLAHTLASIVAKEVGFDVNAGRDEPECDDELAQRQANVVKCEAAVAEAKAALKSVASVLQSLEQEIRTLTQQIPQLEELKKTAAECRDFKAAGKASKDIKEATARLSECNVELESETAGRTEAEHEVGRLSTELEQAQRVAEAMERESATATMERLADNIKRLVATKESVCEKGTKRSVTVVGAFVLEAQIKVLTLEGEAYGDKYGRWSDLMSGVDLKHHECCNDKTIAVSEEAPVVDASPLVETEPVAVDSAADTVSKPPDNGTVPPDDARAKMLLFRNATQRLSECEQDLESAVAADDFEKAAELDEVLQHLLAEVQALNMTDDEMAQALAIPLECVDDTNVAATEEAVDANETEEVAQVESDGNTDQPEQKAIENDVAKLDEIPENNAAGLETLDEEVDPLDDGQQQQPVGEDPIVEPSATDALQVEDAGAI